MDTIRSEVPPTVEDAVIVKELAAINAKADNLMILADCVKELVQKHNDYLLGNGREGLMIRVDRLEQAAFKHKWAIGVAFSGALAAILEFIHKWT